MQCCVVRRPPRRFCRPRRNRRLNTCISVRAGLTPHFLSSSFLKMGFSVSLSLRGNNCYCDLLSVLCSPVKVPVFREEGSRGANAGEVGTLSPQWCACRCRFAGMVGDVSRFAESFSPVPSLRPALSSTTTETNQRMKMGLTETGTKTTSWSYFHYCASFWC